MNGLLPFDLVKHVLVGSSEDNSASCGFFASFEEDKIVVTNSFLDDLITLSQIGGVEDLITFRSGEGVDDSGSS
jgi:hypothetical protein